MLGRKGPLRRAKWRALASGAPFWTGPFLGVGIDSTKALWHVKRTGGCALWHSCENGSMSFSREQQSQVIGALGQKIGNNACPGCGQRSRQLIPDLFLLPAFHPMNPSNPLYGYKLGLQPPTNYLAGQTPVPVPTALPCVVVVCGNCGFTEFYNVHRLGLGAVLNVPDPGVPIG